MKPFTEYSADDFRALVSTNLEGYIYIAQLAVKQMLAQKSGGSVVGITSSLVENPNGGLPVSLPMITKGGLEASHEAWPRSMRRSTSASIRLRQE